jgi:glycerol-3-phosphate dehydrogenase
MPSTLGSGQRADALRRMATEQFDVLVIGGGVVGAGTALDAVSRGLSVAVVEAADWAAGTSSKSSKLIHGGLRYLEQRDFRLVAEALRERALLLNRLAPHLVHPVPFLVPLTHHAWERVYIGAGVTLYDAMGAVHRGSGAVPRHRHLTRRAALKAAPVLRGDGLVGAIRYFDAQVDDARFTMTLARTAVHYGAAAATRAAVTGLLREGERVTGATVADRETGEQIAVRARQVINATGVWSDRTLAMAGTHAGLTVRAAKGIHLVVPRDRIRLDTALILRTEKSVLLLIPWGRHWIIGTTDTAWDQDTDAVAATEADIDYLLEHVNAALKAPLTRDDIEAVYAGLRPLIAGQSAGDSGGDSAGASADASAGDSGNTARLSREHIVARPVPGLVMIAGGKFTTYRVMARDAVNAAAEELPGTVPESVTERLPLAGAVGYEVLWNDRHRLAARAGLHVEQIEHLLNRYGSDIEEVLALIEDDRELGLPVPGAASYLKAEVVYAAACEGALHLDDVLARRTRIAIEERDSGMAAAPAVAGLMAAVLRWDSERTKREVAEYQQKAAAERAASHQPDDVSAAAALETAAALVCD